MMNMKRGRVWFVGVLLLLLAGALVMRYVANDVDGLRATLREDAGAASESVRVRTSTSTRADEGAAPARPTSTLTVRVDVVPAGSDIEWRADVHLLPTRARQERVTIGGETRRGADTVAWDVPCERIAVHVHSEHGFGEVWRELEPTPSTPEEVRLEIHAPGRVVGRVADGTGRGLDAARIVIVPTERVAVPGLPPRLRSEAGAELSVETDADGDFAIENVDPRVPYHAAAARPGFAVRRAYGLLVPSGGETRHDFSLELGCRVTGRLLDAQAQPVAGAQLRVSMVVRQEESGLLWDSEGESVSGADGRFAFDCLGPGWKKVQTVLALEKGSTTVGHWECRVERGDVCDLGDLLLRASLFELELRDPEGVMEQPDLRLYAVPEPLADGGADGNPEAHRDGALIMIPVILDDDGVVRVRGLPGGRVMGIVRDTTPYDDGMWRPRSDFEEHFDGTTASVRWTVNPLQEGERERIDARGLRAASVTFELPESDGLGVALVFVNDVLTSIQPASAAGVGVGGGVGDRVRLVVTDGERWGEHRVVLEEESEARVRPRIRADRPGYTLEVLVQDDGRAVPEAYVMVGPAAAGKDGLMPFLRTGRDGRALLQGLPPETDLLVGGQMFRSRAEPQRVEWVGGRATVIIDVGEQ